MCLIHGMVKVGFDHHLWYDAIVGCRLVVALVRAYFLATGTMMKSNERNIPTQLRKRVIVPSLAWLEYFSTVL